MGRLINCMFAAVITGVMFQSAPCQSNLVLDDDDLQLWNDVNVTIAVNDKIDLFLPFTFRLTKNISRFNEGRIGAGVVFKPTKSIAVTPFYTFIRVRNAVGAFTTENRYHLRFLYRFPTKQFGLYHRSQLEYRDRPLVNTWRYRPSIAIEKQLPEKIAPGLKLVIAEEVFYDSASGRFSRNRFAVGVNKTLTKKLSLDLYYLRQDDNFSLPRVLHVIGTAWKVKL